MNGAIIVPVYNEETVFWQWLPRLLKVAGELGAMVVVVDDGSGVRMQNVKLKTQNEKMGKERSDVVFLRHVVNLGVGAAVETGVCYARGRGIAWVLTIDGDGQHDPEDLKKLFAEIEKGVEVVNGSRFLRNQSIPWLRRIANKVANLLLLMSGSGRWTDSQSGMKGAQGRSLELFECLPSGYAWCSVFLRRVYRSCSSCREVDVSILYTLYSLKKGQCFAQGVDMVLEVCLFPFQLFFKKTSSLVD